MVCVQVLDAPPPGAAGTMTSTSWNFMTRNKAPATAAATSRAIAHCGLLSDTHVAATTTAIAISQRMRCDSYVTGLACPPARSPIELISVIRRWPRSSEAPPCHAGRRSTRSSRPWTATPKNSSASTGARLDEAEDVGRLPAAPSGNPPGPPAFENRYELTRVSVNLTRKATEALDSLAMRQELNQTDIINRAIQLYDVLDKELQEGKKLLLKHGDSIVELKIL